MYEEENKVIAATMLKQKLIFMTGQEFENLFTEIMNQLYPDNFYQVKPQGQYGDNSNDGYLKGKGIYFQVYSPEEIKDEKKLFKKLEHDLEGLINHWNHLEKIKEYNFVVNDKFRNLDVSTNKFMLDIQNKYKDIKIDIRTSNWIIRSFMELKIDKQLYILNSITLNFKNFDFIAFDALSKVIKHIIDNVDIYNSIKDKLEVPNFDKKIEVNGLKDFALILKYADLQSNVLEEFYQSNPEDKLTLQRKIITLYQEELVNCVNKDSLDSVFYKVSERMIPNKEYYSNLSKINKKNILEAIYVILSYFFQVCDIGEPPSKFINIEQDFTSRRI